MKIIVLISQLVILSIQSIKDDTAQGLYLENENVLQYDKVYAININDEDFNHMNNYTIEILEEISIDNKVFNNLNGNEKIFSFNKNDDDDIDIMLLRNGSIQCLYQIKNYIQDDQIIIKSNDCQILIHQQDCSQLYKLDSYIYIIQCNYNSTNTLIQIINSTQILDQIILPIQSNCQSDSIFNNNQTLIIFNKLCETTIFYSISISNLLTFYNLTQHDLKEDISIQDFTPSTLFSMQFCSDVQIEINFHNLFITYILSQKKISAQNHFWGDINIVQRFQICENSNNYVEQNEKTNQSFVRNKRLNISTSFYIQSYMVNSLIIFHQRDELVVLFNNKVKQHITNSFQSLLALTELPLIFAIKEKLITIYRVKFPQNFFTVSKDQHLLKKIRINIGQLFPPSHLDYSKIQVFTSQDVKFLLLTSKITHVIEKLNSTICIHHTTLQKTNAFEILIIQQQSNLNFIQANDNLNFCLAQVFSKGKIFVFEKQVLKIYTIIMIKDQILSAYTCEQNTLNRSNKIMIQKDYRDILSFPHFFQLILIYNYKIVFIELKNQQIIQYTQNFETQILNYYQENGYINILLEDCTKANVKISGQTIQVLQDKYPFDCKLILQFKSNEAFITQDKILFIPIKGFRRKLSNFEGEKNIMTIVLNQFLILVRQVQNEYQLKLFCINQSEAIFLYNLQTYDFQITDSIQYQTLKDYLIIRAQKQDTNYLLTYDVSKTALLSLIRITQIDQYETFFQIISSDSFLYYFQGKFRIKSWTMTCFNYFPKAINDSFIYQEEIQFQIISQINYEILPFKLELITISDDYYLRMFKQEQQAIISKNTINLSNIHGNFENVEILPQDDYQIMYPLTFTDVYKDIIFYEQGIGCHFLKNILIINYFEDHQFYIEENTIGTILNVGQTKDKNFYQVFYISTTNDINLMTINIKLDQVYFEIKKTAIPDIIYKNLFGMNYYYQGINIIKISTTQNLSIFDFQNQPNQIIYNNIYAETLIEAVKHDEYLEVAYLIDQTFLFISDSTTQNILMRFFVITQENEKEINYDIKLEYQLMLNKIIPEALIPILFEQKKSFKIFEIQIEQDLIHFQLGVFFIQYFSLLISFQMDINFQSIPKVENTAILRYQKEFLLSRLLYVDNNFTILILNLNNDEFVYVYDTRRKITQHNIDSIQRLKNYLYTGIERFNQSHYVLKSKKRIFFITLDELKFTCQTECQPIKSIELSNEVSKISIEISDVQHNKISSQKVWKVEVCIILTTLIFILLIQRFQRKKNIQAKSTQN